MRIYIIRDCHWSQRAIILLNALSIPHEAFLIDNDECFKKIMEKSNHNTFPQIFSDDCFFGGYDELSEHVKFDNLNSLR